MQTSIALLLVALLSACSGRGRGDDDDVAADGDADADTDADSDADTDADADSDADGDADGCQPEAGDAVLNAGCDEVEIAVLEPAAGPALVQVRGRIVLGLGDGACARVDSVEVRDGETVVQTLDGSPDALGLDLTSGLLATGDADPSLVARCGTEEPWANADGLVVRGRADGGTFEARCGTADMGTGWPPRTILTCHEGLDSPPGAGNAMVEGGQGFTWTDLYASFPHAAGFAVTSVDPTIHIRPATSWFGGGGPPLVPFDTQDWSAFVSETDYPGMGPATQASLHADGDPLGLDLCPVPLPEPDPMAPPPPVFLARLTGATTAGAFSSEVYVRMCTRAVQ